MTEAKASTAPAAPLRFLREADVCRMVGYGRSSVRAFMSQGRFPKAVKVGANRVAWIEAEVQAWMAGLVAARDAENVAA